MTKCMILVKRLNNSMIRFLTAFMSQKDGSSNLDLDKMVSTHYKSIVSTSTTCLKHHRENELHWLDQTFNTKWMAKLSKFQALMFQHLNNIYFYLGAPISSCYEKVSLPVCPWLSTRILNLPSLQLESTLSVLSSKKVPKTCLSRSY